jgi:hypothetical protein
MKKLKVGNRVKIVQAEDSYNALGKIGRVVKINYPIYLIKIDGWEQGHNGDLNVVGLHHWWFLRKALRLIPSRKRVSR